MHDLRFTSAITVEGRFVRQQGGRERFGHVLLTIEPCAAPGVSFSWEVLESQVPSIFRRATFDGIEGWFRDGAPLEGYELQHTKIRVVDGSYHETDSNDLSYTFAATNAFAAAVNIAGLLPNPLVSPYEPCVAPQFGLGAMPPDGPA